MLTIISVLVHQYKADVRTLNVILVRRSLFRPNRPDKRRLFGGLIYEFQYMKPYEHPDTNKKESASQRMKNEGSWWYLKKFKH